MRKESMKKAFAASLAAAMAVSLTACGSQGKEGQNGQGETDQAMDVTMDQIKLGEDYTDISADLKFLTHKTDVIDTTFADYITEFRKIYPNINIEYEGITAYADDITTRLTTGDWGDICMVPTSVDKKDIPFSFWL